jgi:hypothetical protein
VRPPAAGDLGPNQAIEETMALISELMGRSALIGRPVREAVYKVRANPMGWTAWRGADDIEILILALDTGEWTMTHNATSVRPSADGQGFASLLHAFGRHPRR